MCIAVSFRKAFEADAIKNIIVLFCCYHHANEISNWEAEFTAASGIIFTQARKQDA